jgi:hypothetical protein
MRCRRPTDLNLGASQIEPLRWVVVKSGGLFVQKPLVRGVEFLEDVLDKAIPLVHAHAPVVLPATFIGDVPVGIFARNDVVEVAPHAAVHSVNQSTARIQPPLGTLLADGVGSR